MRVLPYGTRAVLVEVENLDQATRLHATLHRDPPPGTLELVPAARTVLLRYDPARTDRAGLTTALHALDLRAARPSDTAAVVIPVHYDGEDLAEVSRLTGLTVRQVIERHTAPAYRVAFCGFSPGFAYLTGVDPALRVPRRSTPRTRVPAGAVALADEFTGVYPRESPGGWQLLGTTGRTLWDPAADPPTLLSPGTTVRFTAV